MLTSDVALCAVTLAAAALCWPQRPARCRLAGRPLLARAPHGVPRRPGALVGVLGAAAGGLVLAGPVGAVTAAIAAGTAMHRWRSRRRSTRAMASAADLAGAIGLLTAELRAGAHPAAAAERVAADAGPAAADVLCTIAATARLCGDVATAVRREAESSPDLARPLEQLAAAWALAQRHGIPLAGVLDAVRGDLDHRVRANRRLRASLAGPRATAMVLAGLPALGLLLGQAVGAQPWRVLTTNAAGQLLLLVGALLITVGLSWSAHLVNRAATR
jgi:tight adherence protein B